MARKKCEIAEIVYSHAPGCKLLSLSNGYGIVTYGVEARWRRFREGSHHESLEYARHTSAYTARGMLTCIERVGRPSDVEVALVIYGLFLVLQGSVVKKHRDVARHGSSLTLWARDVRLARGNGI